MKTIPRVILIATLLVLSIAAVLPVSAGHWPSSTIFQSDLATPTVPSSPPNTPTLPPPPPTSTPFPPPTYPPPSTFVPPTLPPPSYTIIAYWTVQPGQTLYCIGRYYRVSPWAIASVNHIPWPYWIHPGQVLAIPNAPWYNMPPGPVCYPGVTSVTPTPPSGGPPPAITPTPPGQPVCRYYHYVRWGQTLSGIAWYYGTTIQAIMYANPRITNPNLIYAGSTLCIP